MKPVHDGTDDSPGSDPLDQAVDARAEGPDRYSAGAERPIGTYAIVLGAYATVVAGLVGIGRRRGHRLPQRLEWGDVALMALATHKLSRLTSKSPVASPLRAPFTQFEGAGGPNELNEKPRGSGLRHGVGELLTCPFCMSQWIATGFAFGMVTAPGDALDGLDVHRTGPV